ncbi:MAG TPA: glycosyltransferase family 1 protein [Firmicutes bacterium]|nr:glycosyltransferase family 1 protein [Bacillota bacterium]
MKGINLFHSPHYNFPVLYKGKTVVTVHDIIHILYPFELRSKIAKLYSEFMFRQLKKKVHKIITDSESTKNDLVRYFKFKPERIKVIHIGVDPFFRVLEDRAPVEEFKKNLNVEGYLLMFVGLNKYHKNIRALLELGKRLKKRKVSFTLLLAGIKTNQELILKNAHDLGISDNIRVIPYLDDMEMLYAYNAADLFLLLSLYEGFGLPPLEAMSCGTPALVSNASSLPEVVGEAGVLVDPKNNDEIEEKAIKLLEDEKLRKGYITKGLEHVKRFSWKKTAIETYHIYEEVYNG